MTTSVTPDSWRGTAAEAVDDVTGGLAGFLRARSRRLLGSLVRPHRRAVVVLSVIIVVQNMAAIAGPYLVKLGIDRGIPPLLAGRGARTLVIVVVAFLVSALVQAVATNRFLRGTGRVGQAVLFDLRTRLFDHFQHLSLSFHEKYTSGRVVSRLTSDVEAISELLDTGLETLVMAGLSIVSTAVVLLVLDWKMGLLALCVFPFLTALTVWYRRQSEKAYRAGREAVALVIVHFTESLGGIRAVQAFRREPRNQQIFEDVNGRYTEANAWSMRLAAVYGPGIRLLGDLTMTVTLLYGAYRVLGGTATLGVLAAFLLYLRRFFEPMQDLAQFFNVFQAAAAGLEKLSGVLDEQSSVVEPSPDHAVELLSPAGEVRFEHVRFGYRGTVVLPDVDLVIPAGQTVALVGETGAGKTTVARLIARFYDPNAGRVRLDGVDLRSLADATLRRAVVMVTQESFLFSGTVADNIAFGRPSATRPEIEAAARAIGAHEFISALPDGYDTDVRKRGGRLSAGQRQLVAFARAFLADPRVLILDEATSSLDLPSERLVQRALRTLLADRTAVIIAHRLSTVEIADRVLVIDDGRIVEDGAPAALVGSTSRYAALHQAWLESLA
ncbi:MAG TPA: ABC transporter ATP-binding protein [Acidimicrobiales bacterium]|nr:ABC transporter ATP-binding protein [Acidimicrobiales bacterium]